MCKINGHFAKKLSTTSQIIGGGSANPFFYIVFTAGVYVVHTAVDLHSCTSTFFIIVACTKHITIVPL